MEIIESASRAPSLKLYPVICLTTEGKARKNLRCPHNFYFQTLSLYYLFDIIPHVYAPIIVIFYPFLKKKTGSTRCKQTLEVRWRRRKTVHIIGI